jgi:hypothetical protein
MKKMVTAAFATLMLAGLAYGQNPVPSDDFYKLDFSLKEMEAGKLVNTRSYQMTVRGNDNAMSSIRSGGRVPVPQEKGFTYIDVGTNLDVRRITKLQDQVIMDVIAEISGALEGSDGKAAATPPTVRQTRWNSQVLLPLKKPTVLFSSDDPTSRRQLQLEVTVTPIH